MDCNTLEEGLKECSKWVMARRKRNARPAKIVIPNGLNRYLEVSLSDSSDDIIAYLFQKSLGNCRINNLWHYYDSIWICLKDGYETNIDLPVMETILSWFKEENK